MKLAVRMFSKLFLVAIAAFFINAQVVSAQIKTKQKKSNVPSQEQVQKKVTNIGKSLDLSETKTKDLSVIYTNYYDKLREKKQAGCDPQEMKTLRKDFNKQVKTLLSPEEFEKLKSLNPSKSKKQM